MFKCPFSWSTAQHSSDLDFIWSVDFLCASYFSIEYCSMFTIYCWKSVRVFLWITHIIWVESVFRDRCNKYLLFGRSFYFYVMCLPSQHDIVWCTNCVPCARHRNSLHFHECKSRKWIERTWHWWAHCLSKHLMCVLMLNEICLSIYQWINICQSIEIQNSNKLPMVMHSTHIAQKKLQKKP